MNRRAAHANDVARAGVLDDAEEMVEGIQGKEVHGEDVTAELMGAGRDILRAFFVDRQVGQAAAGGEDVGDGHRIVGGMCRCGACRDERAACCAELGAAIALREDSSESSLIGRRIAGRWRSANDSRRFVHSSGVFADSDVQRAEPAISGCTAREKQFWNICSLRMQRIRRRNVLQDDAGQLLTCLKRANTSAGPWAQWGNRAWL